MIISTVMLCNLFGQKIGVEHYFSYTATQPIENSTVIFIAHSRFIAEIEHGFNAPGVFSLNAGRPFSFGNDKFNAAIRPMIGFTIGSVKGINLNLDQEMELNRFYISTELEYFISPRHKNENFFYAWAESGILFSDKFFGGFSLQGDVAYKQYCDLNKGFVLGCSLGQWTFPVYLFEPFSRQMNIVAGVFYNINFQK